jgi:acyl-[acyl-carrier-protein]-phospholipid O-acyltransferase/long-chain-fatty-acid--[acyl-carrier-protein] ligase
MVDQAVRLRGDDVVVGVLPFFHSFGYAITLWGVLCLEPAGVYHFSPLDARQIGKIAREHRATVLLATPTFLRGYMRRIDPEDFKTLSVVVVGAEKMPTDLFDAFEKRFGCRPVEGYGMTEMGPLVSVNVPPSRSLAKFQPDRREGSVGRPLVGVACRVVSDEGEELAPDTEGLLEVRGPNLMLGYMGREDLTDKAIRDGWYQTGDLAKIDGDGFLHITGRQSRFSKIGGEMVPHGRIEEVINAALREGDDDDQLRAVVTSVPDERKGESLVVFHLKSEKTPEHLRNSLTTAGLPNLYLPAVDCFFTVDAIPLLGTGKLDLKGMRDLALKLTAGSSPSQADT